MLRGLAVVGVLFGAMGVAAAAEDLEFRAPVAADGAATAAAMRSLAVRALPVYENPNREQFLTNLSALQMVAGEYAAAYATRQSLSGLRRRDKTAREVDEALIYDLYARARATAAKRRMPFDRAFAQVFHEAVSPLDDLDAYTVTEWLATPLPLFEVNLQRELDRLRGRERISLSEAVDLAWTYLSFEAFQSFGPLVGPLVAEDDRARYLVDDRTFVRAPGHAALSAVVIRPRSVSGPLPTLLELTMGEDPRRDARDCAAHGYAGVVAYRSGASAGADVRAASGSAGARSSKQHASGERDGDDAGAVIDWIAGQPWSDGRVGVYGSGYGAQVAWAAAKRPPPALKALAVSSPAGPGAGAPYQKEFARIDFPVLTTTGYYDPREADSLYYFIEHAHYDPHAQQTLLIGPYDSRAMQRGPLPVLAGYSIDEAAVVDLHELRYAWFDHVLKGAPGPDLLQERVNFEVMGANAWRHAASLEAMANGAVRLYLDPARAGSHYRLSGHEPSRTEVVEEPIDTAGATGPDQTVGAGSTTRTGSTTRAGRSDGTGTSDGAEDAGGATGLAGLDGVSGVITGVMTRALPPRGAVFVSGPLHRPLQVSGRISGELAFAASRGDVAVALRVYELRPTGEYFQIFAPPEELCAGGCAPASGPRRLQGPARPTKPSREQRLEFQGDRLTSVELQTGSRIVVVIDAGERADASGGRAGAGRRPTRRRGSSAVALPQVTWYGGSFIELPIWR